MSNGKLAGALVGIFILATIAGTWAAYSYSLTVALAAAAAPEADDLAPQVSNADTKSDRLSVETRTVAEAIASVHETTPQAAASVSQPATYNLAALTAVPAEPLRPRVEPRKPAAAPEKEKSNRAEQQKLLLDDVQIASLRTRLKLTPAQEEFWPAVEVTLRDMIRAHARKRKSNSRGAPKIDVNSAEVQQLIAAATPLIMRLSEEQKREVRALARIIGLETVAARI